MMAQEVKTANEKQAQHLSPDSRQDRSVDWTAYTAGGLSSATKVVDLSDRVRSHLREDRYTGFSVKLHG